MNRMSLVVIFTSSIFVSGCGGPDMGCSNAEVKAAVIEVFRDKILSNPVIAERMKFNMFVNSPKEGVVELLAVRTRNESPRKNECISNIKVSIPVSSDLNKVRKINGLDELGEESRYKFEGEILYVSELTDSGEVYVSIEDLR